MHGENTSTLAARAPVWADTLAARYKVARAPMSPTEKHPTYPKRADYFSTKHPYVASPDDAAMGPGAATAPDNASCLGALGLPHYQFRCGADRHTN